MYCRFGLEKSDFSSHFPCSATAVLKSPVSGVKLSRPGTPVKMNARWIVSCVMLMLVASSFAGKLVKPHALSTNIFKPQGSACEVCVGFITTDINMILQAIMGTCNLKISCLDGEEVTSLLRSSNAWYLLTAHHFI